MSSFFNDLRVLNDLRVFGNLNVQGTTSSIESTVVNIADRFLYLNKNHTNGPVSGGIVVNIGASGSVEETTLNGVGFSADSVDVVTGQGWSIGDFIQVSGADNTENNGLHQIILVEFNNPAGFDRITVSGGSPLDFMQTTFIADPNDTTSTITKVAISVIKSSIAGILQFGSGSNVSNLVLESIATVVLLADYLPLVGGVMTGDIDMNSNNITGVLDATVSGDLYLTGRFKLDTDLLQIYNNAGDAHIEGSSGTKVVINSTNNDVELNSNGTGIIALDSKGSNTTLNCSDFSINGVVQDNSTSYFFSKYHQGDGSVSYSSSTTANAPTYFNDGNPGISGPFSWFETNPNSVVVNNSGDLGFFVPVSGYYKVSAKCTITLVTNPAVPLRFDILKDGVQTYSGSNIGYSTEHRHGVAEGILQLTAGQYISPALIMNTATAISFTIFRCSIRMEKMCLNV
jgi:hypothetical protein